MLLCLRKSAALDLSPFFYSPAVKLEMRTRQEVLNGLKLDFKITSDGTLSLKLLTAVFFPGFISTHQLGVHFLKSLPLNALDS